MSEISTRQIKGLASGTGGGGSGSAGINAYSLLSSGYTQPAINGLISLQIPSAYWLQVGQYVFIPSGGYYTIASGIVPTFVLQNLGLSGVNIPVGSTVSAAFISPGGVPGAIGPAGSGSGTGLANTSLARFFIFMGA